MNAKMETEKQTFIDALFQPEEIRRFEDFYGQGYLGPGGYNSIQKYSPLLELRNGDFVLDIGCGTGGNAFYLSDTFGAVVLGTDLSTNIIKAANKKLEEQKLIVRNKVRFQVVDADNMDFEEATFDAVFCKDAFLYVYEKPKVLSQIMKWLKPGGKLLIIDHVKGSNKADDHEFREFYLGRHWYLCTIEAQKQLIEASGFTDVMVTDASQGFVSYLRDSIAETQKLANIVTEEDKDHHYKEQQKLRWCQEGLLAWAVYLARKPE